MTTQPSNSISDERNFRPKTLEDFIGQGDLKKTLRLMLDSTHQRSATLEHVVFYCGPVGPRSLAANAGLDLATVEHVIEPALLPMGLIAWTPRGRRITRHGYAHAQNFMGSAPAINWNRVESSDGAFTAPPSDLQQ